mmetsp:Transcript_25688/g.37952  ORF Transcript_25688/g.37952 Transcript_25688/m.37952 type:complete len:435 (-) Transcript_25688:163-1467(-)
MKDRNNRISLYRLASAFLLLSQSSHHCVNGFSTYPTIRTTVQKRAYAMAMMTTKNKTYLPQPYLGGQTEFSASLPSTLSKDSARDDAALPMVVDERREFEINLGRAVDRLRKDYPDMLVANPDFEIYHDDIEVIDPSGVKLHGLGNYEKAFSFIHAVINFFYCKEESGLTFRLHYDAERRNIRVSWNAFLVPRTIYGGVRNKLHVDGISVYELNREGIVMRHKLERILVNNVPVKEPKGVFVALSQMIETDGVPVLGVEGPKNFRLEFRGQNPLSALFGGSSGSSSSLFSSSSDGQAYPEGFNEDAYIKKNASRQKFGLKPISVEEFMMIEEQVKKLDDEMKDKANAFAASASEFAERKEKQAGNFLSKMLGNVFDDACDSNWDCERPKVCCDLGFKRMCCSSGMGIIDGIPADRYKQRIVERVTIGKPSGELY